MMNHQKLDSSQISKMCYQLILMVSLLSHGSFDQRVFLSRRVVSLLFLLQCLHVLIDHFQVTAFSIKL